jgi:molecular chaperone DnaK (HSP70)
VAQGDKSKFSENVPIDGFEITDLPAKPRGGAQILVTFELDKDGILRVTAVDRSKETNTKSMEMKPLKVVDMRPTPSRLV